MYNINIIKYKKSKKKYKKIVRVKEEIKKELQKRLQEAMQMYSLQELADAYGCKPCNLSHRLAMLESGGRGLRLSSVRKLRQALDMLQKK